MTRDDDRIEGLDVLRGVAVIGILFGNVVGFALPDAALLHPFTTGTGGLADRLAWAAGLLLIDGKMRALFALLFGASMLLMLEKAGLDGRDPVRLHRLRMLTLLPIGLAHYLLLYHGDILMLLAVAGLLALPLASREPLALLKWAGGLLLLQLLLNAGSVIPPFALRAEAVADPARAGDWQAYAAALGLSGAPADAHDLAGRLVHLPTTLLELALFALPETIAFMALGMAMLKGGFLAAQWSPAQFRQTAVHGYRIGLPPMALLIAWVWWSGDALIGQAVTLAASLLFRVPIAVAHAALVMMMVATGALPALRGRLAAVGRMALSNYLLSSLLLAALFAPWGAGLYAALGRAMLMLVAVAIALLILLWSPLWLRRWRQGPAEAFWRGMIRRLG